MLAESLAVISAANVAIGQVKTLIGHGSDISKMGKQLGDILTAEETLKAEGNTKKRSLFSRAMGKDANSFQEFLELDKLREARKEIESMMKIYGRPGLYNDWVKFQVEERKRKKKEAEERARARAQLMEMMQYSVAFIIVGGFAIGLFYWAYRLRYGL